VNGNGKEKNAKDENIFNAVLHHIGQDKGA
jgi:hypothetical protein